MPSIDSVRSFSDATDNIYGQYLGDNLKGIYHWAKWEYDSSLIQYKSALSYALKGNIKRSICGAYGNIALVYGTMQNIDSAIFYYDKTIKYARENHLEESLVKNLVNMNGLIIRKGNYVESVKLLNEALEISQRLENHSLLTMVYSTFAELYNSLGNFELSRKYYLLTVQEDSLETEYDATPSMYMNLGESYWRVKNDADSCRYYSILALASADPRQKAELLHAIQNNIGNIFFRQKQIDSALYYYLKAYDQPFTEYFPARKAGLLVNLGNSYLEKKQYEKAEHFLITGYQLSDSLHLVLYQLNALSGLIRLDSTFGNFSAAFEKHKAFHDLEDALEIDQAKNQITELEIERVLEKEKTINQELFNDNILKTKIIQEQEEQNVIYIILLLGSISFTIVQILNLRKIRLLNHKLVDQHEELLVLNKALIGNNEILNAQQLELKELNKTKDKFFSILSHDLKSPFSSVVGMLDLITNDWSMMDEQEKQNIIKLLHNSAVSTFELLEDLLSWSKSQQGLIKFQPSEFSLPEILNVITELLNSATEQKSIQVNISVESNLVLKTDQRLLTQVIQNFTVNAIKYNPRGGSISIVAKTVHDHVCISVTDTGIGIPKAQLDNLFELDCDFNRPGTENEKSSGMGLILCKEYARILHARIEVNSEVGKGSVFSIHLPKNF
ncbi:MAG: tetratricopeptide repeat-containing sensor histidine kinase [Bacteroidales bacterium]